MKPAGWIPWIALVAFACSNSNDEEPPPPPITYQQAPQPGAIKAAPRAPTAAELPVAQDFDEAAENEINAENFRSELDRLEVEIDADSTP